MPDFKCIFPSCQAVFKQKTALTNHEKLHKNSCEVCLKSFSSKIMLTRHKNSEHKAVEKTVITFSDLTYTCEYCKKEFSSKLSLNSHKRAHMNEQTNDKEIDRKKKDAER